MIRKASMRGRRGLGVTIPDAFTSAIGVQRGDKLLIWRDKDKLCYSTEQPDRVVEWACALGRTGATSIVTLPQEWVKEQNVTSRKPLDVSLKGSCIIVRVA